jgi:phosphonate transport system substrate-binding protein
LLIYLKSYLNADEVKIVSAPDYKGMGDLLKNRNIDLAWLGTKNYLRLKSKLKIDPLVRPIRFGKPYYGGIIITRVDTGINSISDLKGKTFAFVDKGSASGYLYPLALLLKNGIYPERDFKKVLFLGEHDTVVYNVFLKKVDAGSVYDDARYTLNDAKQRKELKVIAHTAQIPNEPIVVRADMPENLKEKLKAAFLSFNLKDEKTGAVLRQYNAIIKDHISGFASVSDKDYDVVRDLQKIVDNYLSSKEGKQKGEKAKIKK